MATEVRLFGGFEVQLPDGRLADLPGQKDRGLLAVLALQPGAVHTRDKLAGLLWSERGESQARDSLKHALTRIRQCFGPSIPSPVVADRRSISVDPSAVTVDVAVFEQLVRNGTPEAIEQASALYRGDFLEGLNIRDPAFEDWLLVERRRLRQLVEDAQTKLLGQLMAAGPGDRAAAIAYRLLSLDPLREPACRALMQIHAERGQTAQALKLYESLRDRLHRELGVKPEPATVQLYGSIRERRTGPAPPAGDQVPIGAVSPPESKSSVPQESAATIQLPPPSKPSIAVLPFTNMSGEADQQYFSDGVSEDIITELSRFHSLLVIARNSSFQYRGGAIDVKRVGRELGVQYIVEGSVRKAAEKIRITAQLVDATTGSHLWAHRYDRDLRDIFAIQDEVATAIVSTVAGEVQAAGIEQARRKRTDQLPAYDYLLRGLELVNRFSSEDFAPAKLMFEKAIAIDANFAQAHAWLAFVLVQLFWLEIYRPEGQMAELDTALAAAQKAVTLDGNDGLCHRALGFVHFGRKSFDLAEYHCDLATRLNPNDADSFAHRSLVETFTRRPDQAINSLAVAMRLNPRPPNWYWADQGLAFYGLRRYMEAANAFERATARPASIQRYLAACYAQMGRTAEARAAVAEALRLQPTFTLRVWTKFETYKFQADLDHMLEGFRKAGLPE